MMGSQTHLVPVERHHGHTIVHIRLCTRPKHWWAGLRRGRSERRRGWGRTFNPYIPSLSIPLILFGLEQRWARFIYIHVRVHGHPGSQTFTRHFQRSSQVFIFIVLSSSFHLDWVRCAPGSTLLSEGVVGLEVRCWGCTCTERVLVT